MKKGCTDSFNIFSPASTQCKYSFIYPILRKVINNQADSKHFICRNENVNTDCKASFTLAYYVHSCAKGCFSLDGMRTAFRDMHPHGCETGTGGRVCAATASQKTWIGLPACGCKEHLCIPCRQRWSFAPVCALALLCELSLKCVDLSIFLNIGLHSHCSIL